MAVKVDGYNPRNVSSRRPKSRRSGDSPPTTPSSITKNCSRNIWSPKSNKSRNQSSVSVVEIRATARPTEVHLVELRGMHTILFPRRLYVGPPTGNYLHAGHVLAGHIYMGGSSRSYQFHFKAKAIW